MNVNEFKNNYSVVVRAEVEGATPTCFVVYTNEEIDEGLKYAMWKFAREHGMRSAQLTNKN